MSAPTAFAISNWKGFEKGALRGFFDVELPSGMILRSCSLFEKDSRRWLGMPSKPRGEGRERAISVKNPDRGY
jgi:hypothetical protein